MRQVKYKLVIFFSVQIIYCLCGDLKENQTIVKFSNETEKLLPCYIKSNQSNTTWELVWEEQFESEEKLISNWKIAHEDRICSFNYKGSLSCNRRENVQLHKGYLTMMTKDESYYKHNYTAARLTSKQLFTEGRYEFRAAQPVGRQIRACIFTTNEFTGNFWFERGQIDLMCYQLNWNLHRGVVFSQTTEEGLRVSANFMAKGRVEGNLHEFHLYGVEWNQKQIQFFFDDFYTEPILFNKTGFNEQHQLRIQIAVGDPNEPLPEDHTKMFWDCPAFIMDHIKIYKNITNQVVSDRKLCNTIEISKVKEAETIAEICEIALMKKNLTEKEGFNLNFKTMIIMITVGVIFFISSIVVLLGKMCQMKRKIAKRDKRIQEFESQLYYEMPKYEGYEIQIRKSYLDLKDDQETCEENCSEDKQHENRYIPLAQ